MCRCRSSIHRQPQIRDVTKNGCVRGPEGGPANHAHHQRQNTRGQCFLCNVVAGEQAADGRFQYQCKSTHNLSTPVTSITIQQLQLQFLFDFPQTRSNFVSIAEVLLQTFDDDIEIYWITKGFHSCALDISADLEQLKESSFKLLEKEDNRVYT